jgi:hypothetical protein
METIPNAALKEWAIVCKALEEGRQQVLLRKGGIMEYRNGFELKHNIFYLFPTFEHQSKELIQPDYASNLDIIQQNTFLTDSTKNNISSFAKVVFVREINDRTLVQKLEKYHIWNDRYVNIRMEYNPKKPMSVILLRVYKINRPFEVNVKPEWKGCKSWIPISFSDNTSSRLTNLDMDKDDKIDHPATICNNKPTLDDSKFEQIAGEIEKILS